MSFRKVKPQIEFVGGLHDGWKMDAPAGISCIIMPNHDVNRQVQLERWEPKTGDSVIRYVEDFSRSTETKRKFLFERLVIHGTSDI